MPSEKSASVLGWFGLIAVVALIGGGFLYQREGGKIFGLKAEVAKTEGTKTEATKSEERAPTENRDSPKVTAKPTEKSETPAAEGTLIVKTKSDTLMPPDFRLYIDGKIVRSQKISRSHFYYGTLDRKPVLNWMGVDNAGRDLAFDGVVDLENGIAPKKSPTPPFVNEYKLKPKTYVVEVAQRNYFLPQPGYLYPDGIVEAFPIFFRKQEVRIEAGKTAVVEFDVGARFLKNADIPKKCRDLSLHYEVARKCFPLEVAYAFDKVATELQTALPNEPAVWVSLPASFGGRRQFDADQLWAIANWVKWYGDNPASQVSDSILPLPPQGAAPRGVVVGQVADDPLAVKEWLDEYGDRERMRPELLRVISEYRKLGKHGSALIEKAAEELKKMEK